MRRTRRHGGLFICEAPSFFTVRGRRSRSSLWCTSSAARGGLPGRPPGRPGPQPGPSPGPGRLGDVIRSVGDWRCGPGRAGARSGLRAGSHFRGFDFRPGGRLRGLPTSGGQAPPTLFPPARVILLLCLPCVAVSACSSTPRAGPGRTRARARGGALPQRLRAALWEPCGAARPQPRRASAPFLCPEQCAGLG